MQEADAGRAAKRDFFISYTAADQDAAEWIAWVLEDAGYKTVIQAWDFQPGGEFVTEMQQALVNAQRVLAVLSPAYLDSAFARQEWNAALADDPTGKAGRLLPVRVAEVALQGLDRPRIYVDLVGLPKERARQRLLAGVRAQRAKPTVEPRFPDRLGRPPTTAGVEGLGGAGQVVDQEFMAHWDPRARGVASALDPGWYFAGRTRVLRDLVTWLGDPDLDNRARVVTGAPGSGKSAVLARLVTLTDPEVRQRVPQPVLTGAPAGTVPRVGSIDVAIHARNKTLADVLATLAAATEISQLDADPTATPEQQITLLVDQLVAQPRQRVIVVDALDEAADPEQLTIQLLRPLAASAPRTGLRLLVGTRRPLVGALGRRIVTLDLDDPAYLEEADLAEYVTKVLLAEHDPGQSTPYRGHRELAAEVAWAVARRANPTFLIARIAARSLATADDPLDTSHPGWELRLPATVGDAFEAYLERFDADQQRARDLLAPVAFAEGAGLPEELWAPLADALCETDGYTDDDVGWVQHAAGAYLIEVRDHGRPAYRLYHQALAEHLRAQHLSPEPQRRITQALRALVPTINAGQPAWDAAHPYLRAHLASHAAAARQLDDLLIDPGFLLAADPDRLLRALPAANRADGQQAADAYRGALHRLRGRPLPEAAAYLQLASRQHGADDLAARVEQMEIALPWSVPWAHYVPAHSNLTLGTHAKTVVAVAVAELYGQPIAITGGDARDSTVRVWDLASGTQLYQLTGHTGPVDNIAVTELDGRPLAVTGCSLYDMTVRVWDLASGTQLHQFTGTNGVCAVAEIDGRPVAITGSYDGTARVWDLASGTQLHQLTGQTGPVSAIAVAELDGLPLAVTGSTLNSTVWVWDLAGGAQLGRALEPSQRRRRSRRPRSPETRQIAVAELDGRPIAITGSDLDGAVWVWDLADGTQLHQLIGHTYRVTRIAVAELDGRPIAITRDNDGTVRVWDLASGTQLHQLTSTSGVIAVGELAGRPIAITCNNDDTMQIWDLADGTQLHRLLTGHTGHTSGTSTIAIGELDGRPIAITGSNDGTVRVWNLNREAIDASERRDDADRATGVGAATVGELDGRPIAITGSNDGTVRVWDLADGTQLHQLTSHTSGAGAIAVAELGGRPLAITGTDEDGTVRVWDLASGSQLHQLTGHTSSVDIIAVAELDGRPLAITANSRIGDTMWVWDLAIGTQLHQLTSHTSTVEDIAVAELDGRPLAITLSMGSTVWVWDLARGTQLHQLTGYPRDTSGAHAIAVAELDGRPIVVTGSGDGTVRVWDLASGTQLHQLTGHTDVVVAIAVSELDGRPIAITGSNDGTVRVWDLASGTQLHQLTGYTGGPTVIAPGELDGRPIAITGNYDGTLRFWDLTRDSQPLVIDLGASVWALACQQNQVVLGTAMGAISLQLLR